MFHRFWKKVGEFIVEVSAVMVERIQSWEAQTITMTQPKQP